MGNFASRNNDKIKHDDTGAIGNIIASTNTFYIDGKKVARENDQTTPHDSDDHIGKLNGNHSFYIEGLSIQIIGDPVDCGAKIIEGSNTFFIGG